jgi:hypothetical protein
MSATVLSMSDHRAVFVLPEVSGGTVVFLASRARSPDFAHRLPFGAGEEEAAATYARGLALRFGCSIVGVMNADAGGEDVA